MKTVDTIAPIRREASADHPGWVKCVFDPEVVQLRGACKHCLKPVKATGALSDMWGFGRGLINEDELLQYVEDISDVNDLLHFSRYGLCATCGKWAMRY